MKNLLIDIYAKSALAPIVTVDGEQIVCKKVARRHYRAELATEKSAVNVRITKYLEINCGFWFLWYLLYFIISIFGIFDFSPDKKCYVFECEADVDLIREFSNFSLNLYTSKKTCDVEVQANTNIRVLKKECFKDKKARRRTVIYGLFKLLFWLAAVVTLVCVLPGLI